MVQKKNKKNIYTILLNSFFKNGKKQLFKKLIDNLFLNLSKNYKISSSNLLRYIFKSLYSLVEIKKVKIHRRVHMVPFSIKKNRRYYLIIKWLKKSLLEDKRHVSFHEKLKVEIIKILFNKKLSKALQFKSLNSSQAFLNRSNIHYRW
jgi:ribosomal protein S7